MRIVVLGAGRIGGRMAIDLAQDTRFKVTAVDDREQALARLSQAHRELSTIRCDLSDPAEVTSLVAEFDMVVSAVPGFMGYKTLEAILSAGKDVVDIAFSAEDPFTLSGLAEEKAVTAVVDCGVAPGMSNLLVGHADWLLDETETVSIYVGGLPERSPWPHDYRAVFSPRDVIELYTRPARILESGVLVARPALSDLEVLELPQIGFLEAFSTDGLRTLLTTIDAPNMKEKTLRYEGHCEKVGVLREAGFFDRDEIVVRGHRIRPLDATSEILFRSWALGDQDRDLTVMRVIVEGKKDGERTRFVYDLFDRYDEISGVHSMARTTGYTAAVAVRLLAEGLFVENGVFAPERIGQERECVEFFLRELRERGVIYEQSVEKLDG